MIVEFGVLAIALTIVQTVWLSATAYPVSHTSRRDMTYVEFVGRSNVVSQVEDWNKAIVSQRGISDTVSAGKLLFQKTNVRHVVPNKFMAGSRYLLPEGIREVGLGVSPKKMNPSLMVGTWSEAVSQWNADPSHSVGASADQILESTPDSISYLSLSIAHLNDIRNKPMLAQVGLTLPWISTVTFSSCAIAAAAMNAGWLFWCLYEVGRRIYRRRTYHSGRQRAV